MQEPSSPEVELKGDSLIERIKKKILGEREGWLKKREEDYEARLRIVGHAGKARRWALSDLKRARRRLRNALRRKVEVEAGVRKPVLTLKQIKRRKALKRKRLHKIARRAREANFRAG